MSVFRFVRRHAAGLSVFALALAAVSPAAAHGFKAGSVEIAHPWSRATPPGATVGAGYLGLTNEGSAPDRLVKATTPAAERVEMHEMSMANGVMSMRPAPDGVEIPAGKSVVFKPSGLHLMLIGLKAPLKVGDKVPLTLTFEKGGPVDVYLQVEAMTASGSEEKMGH